MARKKIIDRTKRPGLSLVQVEPHGGKALHLVFEEAGTERRWELSSVTVREFLALLLRGRMGKSGRVMSEAGISIEPPDRGTFTPMLCIALPNVEICIPTDRKTLAALKADIERALKSAR